MHGDPSPFIKGGFCNTRDKVLNVPEFLKDCLDQQLQTACQPFINSTFLLERSHLTCGFFFGTALLPPFQNAGLCLRTTAKGKGTSILKWRKYKASKSNKHWPAQSAFSFSRSYKNIDAVFVEPIEFKDTQK